MFINGGLGITDREMKDVNRFIVKEKDGDMELWIPGFSIEFNSKEDLIKLVSDLYDAHIKENNNEKNESF